MNSLYYKYSDYLVGKYGQKVYKLPVSIPVTCPNRDGRIGFGGCDFCGGVGAGFETKGFLPIDRQIAGNKNLISKKYNASKFIVYFQTFTSTYLAPETLHETLSLLKNEEGIVEVSFSTRPDSISERHLQVLAEFQKQWNISIELGLQTVNYHTLNQINRGHTLAEFIDAVLSIQKFGFDICAQLILNLPTDTMTDVIENAKVLSALHIDMVKLHALYIEKGTKMAEDYCNQRFTIIPCEEYIERVITFLEFLSPDIAVQRLIGRVPEEFALFANWGKSWWVIKEEIERQMQNRNSYQGKQFCYLKKAVYESKVETIKE